MFPNLIQSSNIGQNWQLGQNLSPENALKLQDIERRQQIANLFTQQAMTPKGAVKAGNRFMVAPSGWEHAATLMNAAAGAGGMYMAGQERQDMMADIIANRAKGMEDLQRGLGQQPEIENVNLGLDVGGFTLDPALKQALNTPTPTVPAPPQPTVTNSTEPYSPIAGMDASKFPTPGARDPNAVSFKPAGQPQARDPNVSNFAAAMASAGFRGVKDDALIQASGQTSAIPSTTTTPSAAPVDAGAVERLAVAKAMSKAGYPNKKQLDDMFISGRGAMPMPDPTTVPTAAIPADQAPSYLKLASDNLSKPTHEGLRLTAYNDSGGQSIGYGHRGPDVKKGMTITKEQAEQYRDNDLAEIDKGLTSRYPWFQGLDDTRKAFMAELAYNTGLGGIAKFAPTLDLIKTGDYAGAVERLKKTPWAKNNVPRVNDMLAQLESAPDVPAAPIAGNPQAMQAVASSLANATEIAPQVLAFDDKTLNPAAAEAFRLRAEQGIPSDTTVPSPVSRVASSLLDAQGPPPPSALSVKPANPFSYSYKEYNTRDATPEERRNAYLKAEANPDPLVQRAAYRAMEMDDRDEQRQLDRETRYNIANENTDMKFRLAMMKQGGRKNMSATEEKMSKDASDAYIALEGLRDTLSTPQSPGSTGILQSMVPSSILNILDPEGIPTRSAVSNFESMITLARSGKAVSANESRILEDLMPKKYDKNKELKIKVEKFKAFQDKQNKSMLAMFEEQGLDIHRLAARLGVGGVQPEPSPSDQALPPSVPPSGKPLRITSFAPVQ